MDSPTARTLVLTAFGDLWQLFQQRRYTSCSLVSTYYRIFPSIGDNTTVFQPPSVLHDCIAKIVGQFILTLMLENGLGLILDSGAFRP